MLHYVHFLRLFDVWWTETVNSGCKDKTHQLTGAKTLHSFLIQGSIVDIKYEKVLLVFFSSKVVFVRNVDFFLSQS